MDFYAVLDAIRALLQHRRRVTYRALKVQFHLDDEQLEALKEELVEAEHLAVDEQGKMLVWTGPPVSTPSAASLPVMPQERAPLSYTPHYLAEKILTSRSALAGERKQVTVLFADIQDSTALIQDLDPEAAQQLLDPALHLMMAAVHRFEGLVKQVLGDGIMALFGAPLAHEDHALRACYAALTMQTAMREYTEAVRGAHGVEMRIRVGLNSGEVVVRAIGNDLHMDYSAVGLTTHLAARMEQLAPPGTICLTPGTLRLVEGLVQVRALGPLPVKGMSEPVAAYELVGASLLRRRLQAAAARGLTRFVGREAEIATLRRALTQAGSGHGQVVAVVGEAGVGKSRLVYECVHAPDTQSWLVLESAVVSYGKATPYFPVVDLLKRYVHVKDTDDLHTIRAKVTGQVLTLDETLQETIPALLWLLDVLPADSPFHTLEPLQRRQRTLEALKYVLLRESQVQPLLVIFEDLHWIDAETQALLDSLVESLPTARLLLLVNYRPEYQHGWGSKTYYVQLRLDPLPLASAEAFLDVLLGQHPSLVPLKRLLIARTEGNPFFLEESIRTLVETSVLLGQPGAYRVAQRLPTIQVPATVQAVLAARMDRLPPEEKQLLQAAAVIGTEVALPLLQAIAALPEAPLYRGLAHLQAAEFLYETRLFPERAYTFKHALTQQVAYQSLLASTRHQYHHRIAQVLEGQFLEIAETQPELVAHHYTAAGAVEQAIPYWQGAGERASARSAYVEAIGHLTTGLAALETLPDTPARARQELTLHLALGPALYVTRGDAAPEVEQTYRRAQVLCQHYGESAQALQVLRGLWAVYHGRLQFRQARALGEQYLTLAQQEADPVARVEAHYALGTALFYLGEFARARAHFEQGVLGYDRERAHFRGARGGEDPGVACLGFLVSTLGFLGYPAQAWQRAEEARRLAQALTQPYSLAFARYRAGLHALFSRQAPVAQTLAEEVLALATTHGFPFYTALGTALRGGALVRQGQGERGLALLDQGLTALSTTGTQPAPHWLVWQADLYGAVGQPAAGLRLLAQARERAETTGNYHAVAELYRLQGELGLAGAAAQVTEAEAWFQRALALARRQQAKALELRAGMSLAQLWQRQGKRAAARELLAPIYSWFTEGFDTADLQEAKALLEVLA